MVRAARPQDARALAEVQLRAWWHAYADYVPHEELAEHTVESRTARWEWILGAGQTTTFVAEVQERIAGFVSVGAALHAPPPGDASAGVGELHAIYVDPPAQGAGVGSRLLHRGEDELRAMGFARAFLCVFERNGLARAFYERHGWRPEEPPVILDDRWAPELRYRRAL